MKKLLAVIFACGLLGVSGAPAKAASVVYSGVLDGSFNQQILIKNSTDKRALRFSFETDASRLSDLYLGSTIDIYIGLTECYPGDPCRSWGDYIDMYDAHPLTSNAIGFTAEADRLGEMCDNFQGMWLSCESFYYRSFHISGSATGGPVEYKLRVTAVPEPATWAMMIVGFGAVGSMVRTSRRRNAFSTT